MAAMLPLEDPRHNPANEPSFATRFSPALINPEQETPAMVAGPKGKLAVKRFNVYRNNVTVSLIDALASIYPAVQRITGVEFFRAMARFHIRETPPHSPLLFEYGRDFPAFIGHYEYAQSLPYLADVARIERAWLDAYHAADASPLAPEALAAVPPERLADVVFTPHPAMRIVRSQFSAVTIFAANRAEGPIGTIESTTPEDALITRPDLEVVVRHLPPGGAIFLMHLAKGETLGAAVTAALESDPSFDIPANISGMIEAGAFTTINPGDE
jgi:Putative DNA-binding domain